MILHHLSPELAAEYVGQLLGRGVPLTEALGLISRLDRCRPAQRNELRASYGLVNPPPPSDLFMRLDDGPMVRGAAELAAERERGVASRHEGRRRRMEAMRAARMTEAAA